MKTRKVLLCIQPHGVFSFGGACAGVEWSKKWWKPEDCPTAVTGIDLPARARARARACVCVCVFARLLSHALIQIAYSTKRRWLSTRISLQRGADRRSEAQTQRQPPARGSHQSALYDHEYTYWYLSPSLSLSRSLAL